MTITLDSAQGQDDRNLAQDHGYTESQAFEVARLFPFVQSMSHGNDTHTVIVMEKPLRDLMTPDGAPDFSALAPVWSILNEMRHLHGEDSVDTILTKRDTYKMTLEISPRMTVAELEYIADTVTIINMNM